MQFPEISFFERGEPKSGTTWLEIMIGSLLEYACRSSSSDATSCRCSEERSGTKERNRTLTFQCDDPTDNVRILWSPNSLKHTLPMAAPLHTYQSSLLLAEMEECENRGYKSFADECLTRWELDASANARYVVIFRSPVSVLISRFFFTKPRPGSTHSVKHLEAYVLHHLHAVCAWTAFRYAWHTRRLPASASLVLFYEEMQSNATAARAAQHRILDFILQSVSGKSHLIPPVEQLAVLEESWSMVHMRNEEKFNRLPGSINSSHTKVRNGDVRASSSELSPSIISICNEVMALYLPPTLHNYWKPFLL